MIGRNQPCPCGSGKKYKVCHLLLEQTGPAERARALGQVETRYLPTINRFASTRRPECLKEAAALFWLHRETPDIPLQLLAPIAIYHRLIPGEACVAEDFLAENEKRLMDSERTLLRAQLASWLSIWEILEVERGVGMKVRDRLTGAERFCHERKGSERIAVHDVVLGRVVDCDGVSCFFGMYGQPLGPALADEVEQAVRKRLRKKKEIPIEALRDDKIVRLLIEEWQLTLEAFHARPLPTLANTDGEDLLLTVDRFSIKAADRSKILDLLATVDDMERTDDNEDLAVQRFTLFRPGNAMHKSWENTVLGHVTIDRESLRCETNSLIRANTLRATLEAKLGDRLRFRIREHTDPIALMGKEPISRNEHIEKPPEVQAALQEFLAKHYSTWPDTEVPALGGKTPREAVRTVAGRRAVDTLIRDMENSQTRRPDGPRYDFCDLRRQLGLGE